RQERPGQTHARSKVAIRITRIAMRTCGRKQNALQSGHRLGAIGVEVGEVVVTLLEWGLVFETDSEIDGERARGVPIVLQIPVVAGLEERERRSNREGPAIGSAEHGARQSVATGSGSRGGIGPLRVVAAEGEGARRVVRAERVELAEQHVVAGLDGV